jgi:hypothetical protein
MRSIALTLIVMLWCFACGTNTADQKKLIADSRVSFNLAIASHDTAEMALTYSLPGKWQPNLVAGLEPGKMEMKQLKSQVLTMQNGKKLTNNG